MKGYLSGVGDVTSMGTMLVNVSFPFRPRNAGHATPPSKKRVTPLEVKDQDPSFGSPGFVVSAPKEPRPEQGGKFKVASFFNKRLRREK
jgi:hypothetical protein